MSITFNHVASATSVKSIKAKRKIGDEHISSFLKKKNKKNKLSTYTFNKPDPSIITPSKTMKDVTLTQMKEVVFTETPHIKQNYIQKRQIRCW